MTTVGLSSVTQTYGDLRALNGVDFQLSNGVTVLLGRNGAGKSTLARILVGVDSPTAGDLIRGDTAVLTPRALRGHHRQTGWLPQNLSVPGLMRVGEYLRYAAWLKDVDRQRTESLVSEALTATDLQALEARRLGTLSGGMIRRVGIAQAIVHQPSLLVLDEPTVALDPEQRSNFHELISSQAERRAVLLSTHLLEDVEALATRVLVLEAGAIVFDGSAEALCELGGSVQIGQAALRSGFITAIEHKSACG